MAPEVSQGLHFTAKVLLLFLPEKQGYCGTGIEENGKYRNPEDSGRNMQPRFWVDKFELEV
jgi:hypothetical protein